MQVLQPGKRRSALAQSLRREGQQLEQAELAQQPEQGPAVLLPAKQPVAAAQVQAQQAA